MSEHRFILEPQKGISTKHACPNCEKKTFTFYIDTETGHHVHDSVGRCDRESKCGYHYTPKQYFQDNSISIEMTPPERIRQAPQPKPEPSFIDAELFRQSLTGYESNNLVSFLKTHFDNEIIDQLKLRYNIGTSKHWPGSTVFWQMDTIGKIRTGKVMLYNAITGHRVKEPIKYITWVQSVLKLPTFNMTQCLFGEHLLNDKKPVALCESEKTAIIASVYLPQFIWLATGGLSNFNVEKCSVLAGHTVVLFPDLNGFDKWNIKRKELSERIPNTRFEVSDLLENIATEQERNDGLDIADYLFRFDHKQFGNVTAPPSFETLVQVAEYEAINWFNGHLLASMNKTEICDNLHF